jgi:6-pyruvoyltetrahydropterin/6-carboxytetrahydropterin synthase
VSTLKLNKIGLAYDFAELKAHLSKILDHYDHTCLNEVKPFDKINPSTENIATEIYKELKKTLSKEDVKLISVSAYETPNQGVEYRP